VSAAGRGGEREEQSLGGFAVAFSPEYMRFRSDPAALRHIADVTGGRILQGTEQPRDVFPTERERRTSSRPVFDLLLVFLACLIPLDVAVRRIQVDMHTLRGLFGLDRREARDAVLNTLLLAKARAAARTAAGERPAAPLITAAPAQTPRASRISAAERPPAPAAPAAPAPPALPGDTSTTGRLLAAKRRRKQDKSEATE